MGLLNKSAQIKIILHVILWCTVIFFVIHDELGRKTGEIQLQDIAIYLYSFAVFAVVSYFNILFLIPRYFLRKKYVLYIGFLLTAIIGSSLFDLLIRETIWKHVLSESSLIMNTSPGPTEYVIHLSLSCATMVLVTSGIYIIGEWMRTHELALKYKEAEKEKIAAELKALKAQINPHFLFNTLNNLYSLSIEKSDKAPDVIVKLSDLMSYILYDCKVEEVALKNEMDFISNYLELEKNRFEDRVEINFQKEIDNPSLQIAPLLFIPFIENAFKHGFSSGKNRIDILWQCREGIINFSIENNANQYEAESDNYKKGVGIENVKRRLELLYPKNHSVKITNGNERFSVELMIDTNVLRNLRISDM